MKLARLATILAAVLAFTVAAISASAQTQPPPKVQVCHKAANGTFHLITISLNAQPAHVAHGDGQPGQAVPNMPGFIFGDNCTPTVAPPPELPVGCYTLVGEGGGDFFYSGPIDTLGNITGFGDHSDGSCSGTAAPAPFTGIIAAANATDAQTKCDALTGVTGSFIFDLGTPGLVIPSEPGFWICFGPPA